MRNQSQTIQILTNQNQTIQILSFLRKAACSSHNNRNCHWSRSPKNQNLIPTRKNQNPIPMNLIQNRKNLIPSWNPSLRMSLKNRILIRQLRS